MSTPDFRLSDAQVEQFMEQGFLLIPQCFPAALAERMTHATLRDRFPPPIHGRRPEEASLFDLTSVDLLDDRTWGDRSRIELTTGRRLPIAEFAPRLWGAIESLIGPDNPILTRELGQQWILLGREAPGAAHPDGLEPDFRPLPYWHLDSPGAATTLDNRHDALVLLVLWSDCPEGGGGTLYSGQSLEHVIRDVEAHPEGLDTRAARWGLSMIQSCTDTRALVGRAGDVLITHAFALHAAQSNCTPTVRVLENPTIHTANPLQYHTDHPRPSAVERAVIRRLSRSRVKPADLVEAAITYLVDCHEDYFLPGRAAWTARVDRSQQEDIHALDTWLTHVWVDRVAREICDDHAVFLDRVSATIARIRTLVVNQRQVRGELRESAHDDDFSRTTFARFLRGFMNCEGQNHLLGLVLATFAEEVRLVDVVDPATRRPAHALLLVRGQEGWLFADAWSDHPIFHVATRPEPMHPGTPEYDDLARGGADRRHGLFARVEYEAAALASTISKTRAVEPTRAWSRLGAHHAAPQTSDNAWRALLRLRAKHIRQEDPRICGDYAALLPRFRLGPSTLELVKVLGQCARQLPTRATHHAGT